MSDSTADHDERPGPGGGTVRVGRAVFLGTMVAGVASLAWGKKLWSPVSSAISPVESLVPLVPSKGWRIYTVADSMPRFDPTSWRLHIDGLVERPIELSHDQLLALPKAEQVSTFHCVTGWTVKQVQIQRPRPKSAAIALPTTALPLKMPRCLARRCWSSSQVRPMARLSLTPALPCSMACLKFFPMPRKRALFSASNRCIPCTPPNARWW